MVGSEVVEMRMRVGSYAAQEFLRHGWEWDWQYVECDCNRRGC